MGGDCGRLAFLWNVWKVKIFRAEEKDASDFRDQYDERMLSPGQSGKEK